MLVRISEFEPSSFILKVCVRAPVDHDHHTHKKIIFATIAFPFRATHVDNIQKTQKE